MTTVVLLGFFLMLFAPCLFAIYGGRDKKAKAAIASSYADRAVSRVPDPVEKHEFDLPRRREEFLVQAVAPAPPMAVAAPAKPSRGQDLRGMVERAESEALLAHAMAAQANAAALAATARAAQARAQAAAEQAAEANRAAANHVAAVRVAQQYAAATEAAALTEQQTHPELTAPVPSKHRSRRAA